MKIASRHPILLPKNADMRKWAVIACDQYTTDYDYWQTLDSYVGSSPSTLRLIFPEIYLSGDRDKRIGEINSTMKQYLCNGIFEEKNCYVLTERTLSDGRKRIGLVFPVDLEAYDFNDEDALIRPTEQTIRERLPVRIHIRENAPLELPHILLLADDEEKSIIEPLYAKTSRLEKLYDFDLNMNGGHIRGYAVPYEDVPFSAFDRLLSHSLQEKKYGKNAQILFAVGDGNHSMATAKECWEKIKPSLTEEERENHPARFALIELLNVYDDALDFLPIHRVVYGIEEDEFIDGLRKELSGNKMLTIITKDDETFIPSFGESDKTIIALQAYLEKMKEEKGVTIEYVHEEKQVRDGAKNGGIGILMPSFPKKALFNYVVNHGKLPKKVFSIGEEKTKKYYIEAKRIK